MAGPPAVYKIQSLYLHILHWNGQGPTGSPGKNIHLYAALMPAFAAVNTNTIVMGGIILAALLTLLLMSVVFFYGALWLQAHLTGADVRLASLIGMSFRQVKPAMIVTAKIMGRQAGLNIDRDQGMSTDRLEAHFLAGGDVMRVIRAIIVANRAGLDLDFDRAAAIDLAGRDVLDAVRTSVSPKVIDCPARHSDRSGPVERHGKNGVELRVRARVTVRTNLDQLIGGATEETIIARVGQGIVRRSGRPHAHGGAGNARPDLARRAGPRSRCEYGV